MFTYFRARPDLALPAHWLRWLGGALHADAPPPGPVPPEFERWRTVLARHGLLPLLYSRLRDDPQWPILSVETGVALGGAFQRNAARTLILQRELGRIAEAFPWLGLLKGAALGVAAYGGAPVYPDPSLRPVSDLDLLVRPEDAGAAVARLTALGYRGLGAAASPTFGPFARRFRGQLPLVGSIPGIPHLLVELHWSLIESPYYVNLIPPDEIWTGADTRACHPYAIPRPAVLLAHAAAHLAIHHSRDLRLIWLVDADRLARAPALDWDDLLRLADAWKLGLALYATLSDAARWLETPAPKEAMLGLARLANDRLARQAWGIGDDTGSRAWRRAAATFAALPPRAGLHYAGWLAGRAALRPLEWWSAQRGRRP
jgi:hypothetical protein